MAMKTILVTGGNRGIGKAVCQQLLEKYDDTCVILASRSLEKGQDAAQDILKQTSASKDRLHVVEMDTSSKESIEGAAKTVKETILPKSSPPSLYGIVNNAGMLGPPYDEAMKTNYFGPRHVCDEFVPSLDPTSARIVNVASASGPNYVSRLRDSDLRSKLSEPWKHFKDISELDELASSMKCDSDVYGMSKAFVNAYTVLLAKSTAASSKTSKVVVNSVTPGFIATDMGSSLGATKPVPEGAKPILYLLMDPKFDDPILPTGRYYGSDCQRSPIDVYRGPGDPVYEGPDWE
eukprot:CAMPEP_0113467848 /NCGR_PEP_ID=MMETSP0014_2-20120614/15034_1 /TAXON_ID=2857 /ORGANISM="Nitzschia sp." /LENGTH=291 /DNA_ID=CAMNT_0000360185 /DNA_START=207 /DNA_END=1082 /DNA_ORIENTATION=+ /assembly_acc=CAM_ASM_000159